MLSSVHYQHLLPSDFFQNPQVIALQAKLDQLIHPSRIQSIPPEILYAWTGVDQLQIDIKRDDQLHPLISGNKWRKLKYNLLMAAYQGRSTLYTFGGAYSNHIAATAAAGFLLGFSTVGFIRGEAYSSLNPTLALAQEHGMQLVYLNRQNYRKRNDLDYLDELIKGYPAGYWIPEGGTNELAMLGCMELAGELPRCYDSVWLPCGTAGTLAGLLMANNASVRFCGVAVHTDTAGLHAAIQTLSQASKARYMLLEDYHFGGYAKFSAPLLALVQKFSEQTQIPFEPVYGGKMLYALLDQIKQNSQMASQRMLMIHTGGLQGLQGLKQRKILA